MKSRRNFIKNVGLGIGTLTTQSLTAQTEQHLSNEANKIRPGFNMSGYAAPRLDTVRIGIIGLGNRGPGAVHRMSYLQGVSITALCDKIPDRVASAQSILKKAGLPDAREYSGEYGWKKMVESDDIDLIYICTPWRLHAPMGIYAMEHGKHAAIEVPVAVNLDECWQLVETSEKTRRHCMMLENCCYDFFELLTLNMVRNGLLGEIIHAEGSYIHDLLQFNFTKSATSGDWRLWENATRNGNLYPTHGLGPVAQCLNINRGDLFTELVSMSSADFSMGVTAEAKAAEDPYYKQFVGKRFRGNMNTSIVKTSKGKTVMVQHDVSSPRPYSRHHMISGTKGCMQKYPEPERIAFGEEWITKEEYDAIKAKYTPPIVQHIGKAAESVGGHGGMDFMMDWRLIDCLRNGLCLDQDVYDAASWTAVGVLSEVAVKKGSHVVNMPDFTRGNWKLNKPVNLTLDGGGTTMIRTHPDT